MSARLGRFCACLTCAGHEKLDVACVEPVIVGQMVFDLADEVATMVLDSPTHAAPQMKLLVWVSQLPVSGLVGSEVRFADKPEIAE